MIAILYYLHFVFVFSTTYLHGHQSYSLHYMKTKKERLKITDLISSITSSYLMKNKYKRNE